MFDGRENVKDVDLSSFNTKNLESMKILIYQILILKMLKVWNAYFVVVIN